MHDHNAQIYLAHIDDCYVRSEDAVHILREEQQHYRDDAGKAEAQRQSSPADLSGAFFLIGTQILANHGSGCGVHTAVEYIREFLNLVADAVRSRYRQTVAVDVGVDPQQREANQQRANHLRHTQHNDGFQNFGIQPEKFLAEFKLELFAVFHR